jgi:hypothetical protein
MRPVIATAHQMLFECYSVKVLKFIVIVIGYISGNRNKRLYSGCSGMSGQVSIHLKNYLHSRERRTPNETPQILPHLISEGPNPSRCLCRIT